MSKLNSLQKIILFIIILILAKSIVELYTELYLYLGIKNRVYVQSENSAILSNFFAPATILILSIIGLIKCFKNTFDNILFATIILIIIIGFSKFLIAYNWNLYMILSYVLYLFTLIFVGFYKKRIFVKS
jgi:hypothetical protein